MSLEDLKARQAGQVPSESVEKPTFLPLRDAIKAFEAQAARTSGGAPSRGMKADLLRADVAQEKNPDAHLRWTRPDKAESRRNDGYVALSEAEGGKRVGNELILMGLPKQEYERRQEELKVKTQKRLSAHVGEMQNTAESIARTLRDKHGINITAERLLDSQ